jgi:hypothetical protein
VSIYKWFNHLPSEQVCRPEKRQRREQHRPVRTGRSQSQREHRSDPRADIRDETKERRQHAEEYRPRNTDYGEPNRYNDTGAQVDAELGKKIAAQAVRRLVDRDRGPVQIARTKQPNESIAEILALQKDENGDYQHDTRRFKWTEDRGKKTLSERDRRHGRLLDCDRHRCLL